MTFYWGYAGCVKGAPGCFLVIDDKTEMAASVCTLFPARLKGDELIAKIDECHRVTLAPKLEFEKPSVKG